MQAVLAAQTAIAEATLDLGAIAQSVVAQLKTGDLLSALVLPPSGGVDHISLFGQSLPAQLPPGIAPGETLALQVTGFSPTQIFVRNLGPIDPQNPPETVNVEIPPESAASLSQATLIARTPAPSASANPVQGGNASANPAQSGNASTNPAQGGNASATAAGSTQRSAIAPPVEVFVAASVQPSRRDLASPSVQEPVAQGGATSDGERSVSAPAPNPAPSGGAPAATPQQPAANPAIASELEARLAAARGARILPRSPEMRAPAESAATTTPQSAARSVPLETPPPQIAARLAPPMTEENVASVSAQPSAPTPPPSSEEAVLLARLNLPTTPALLAAARAAQNAPANLASAFARAQSALARFASQPAVSTVRAAMAFVSSLDPANAVALPQQLAAYVRTILGSTEGALTTLAENLATLEPNAASTHAPGALASTLETASAPPLPDAARVVAAMQRPGEIVAPPVPTVASPAHEAAVVAAQNVLNQDVKSALIALARDPQSAASPGAANALGDAVTAIAAAQVHVLAANAAADPRTLVVPLPVFFREGGSATQLRIGRDAPGSKNAMNADNFTLGFLLDTKTLGTVAIEIETSGRAVSVKVKTERDGAAKRFREGFDALRDRFEALRYRVATMQAAVAARSMPPGPGKARPEGAAPRSHLDAHA